MSKLETCPVCGKTEFTLHQENRSITAPGGIVLPYEAQYSACANCGEEFFTRTQSRSASRSASSAIRAHLGLLTPQEIVEIRGRYGLTQEALEQVLGLGKKTVVRWEAGTVNQGKAADLLLRQLRDGRELIEKLNAAKSGESRLDSSQLGSWSISVTPVGEPLSVLVGVTGGRPIFRGKRRRSPWEMKVMKKQSNGGWSGENCDLLSKVG